LRLSSLSTKLRDKSFSVFSGEALGDGLLGHVLRDAHLDHGFDLCLLHHPLLDDLSQFGVDVLLSLFAIRMEEVLDHLHGIEDVHEGLHSGDEGLCFLPVYKAVGGDVGAYEFKEELVGRGVL